MRKQIIVDSTSDWIDFRDIDPKKDKIHCKNTEDKKEGVVIFNGRGDLYIKWKDGKISEEGYSTFENMIKEMGTFVKFYKITY